MNARILVPDSIIKIHHSLRKLLDKMNAKHASIKTVRNKMVSRLQKKRNREVLFVIILLQYICINCGKYIEYNDLCL